MDILTSLHTGALLVICAPHAAREQVAVLAATLALRGSLTVLDGGNRFQPYRVAQLLRQHTTGVEAAAGRLFIRRAFTCYQVLALLESTPPFRQPYLILDLLGAFYDDHVTDREARRLLELCLGQLDRLRQVAPLLVTLAPPLTPERAFLSEMVCVRADRVLALPAPAAQASQPALFPG
jgi:hypothetical protein